MGEYVELRCKSAFSFLEGASNPEDLVERAVELGFSTLALADRDGVYGIPRFHQAARAAGLRAIVGAEVEVRAGPEARRLLLLVESQAGYRNLCRLITRGQARAPKGTCWVLWEEVEAHARGLLALLRGDGSLSPGFLDRTLGVFGPGQVWIDVVRHLDRAGEAETRWGIALAEASGVPIVASNDVAFARPQGRRLLDAFTCLREKTVLDRAGRKLARNHERYLKSAAAMAECFADQPGWIRASQAIAERCAFTLDDLGYRFPEFPTPEGEPQATWLRRLTTEGARGRYGHPLRTKVRAQLEHELAVIEKLDLCGYFLIVHDIARYARENKILSQGRGSAANSAVCYALGITAVDAVGMDLLFERFLSEERGEWPDIDLDLPSGAPRESVIQYVFDKYGANGAAMTATTITYRMRSAVREMGKVLSLGNDAIDRLSKILSSWERDETRPPIAEALRQARVDPEAPRIRTLLALVESVRGLPRHLGQHTGGIVIAAGRLDEVVPIEPASMAERRVLQWDKDDCADLGLIKIDLLGLGMLNAIEGATAFIREHEGKNVDMAHIPADDPATYDMICKADTIGVFQIESRAQMATLPRMKPRNFYDLVVEVAIIRPGPIVGQMVNPYLNRRAGREAVHYPHPSLEPILKRTLGVPIFQEQLLRIAMTAAGFSGGESEELRRAMGFKRSAEKMQRLEERLRRGMDERGIVGENQEEILRGINSFALYGFPESHSASFALIAYASAYLKAHHPEAFLAGLLNAYPMGFYSPATLVKDAQRHGVLVRPIDVHYSDWRCSLETTQARPAVRLGLRYVAGLREPAGQAIAQARREQAFCDMGDLAKRAALHRDELEVLAELGALRGVDPPSRTRRSALWQVAALERDPRSLFAGVAPRTSPSPLPEMNAFDATLSDYRSSGITLGPHIMSYLREDLSGRGLLRACDLRDLPNGRFVRTAGHVIVRQRPGSAKGFCFLTLEDETGTSNAVLTPDVFRRFRVPLHDAAIVEIAGPLQNVDDVIHVRVNELLPLAGPAADTAMPDGHNYR